MALQGMRTCVECEDPYIFPFEGGYKYCRRCRQTAYMARNDECKVRARLAIDAETERIEANLRLRTTEYYWEWACDYCGLKHKTLEEAVSCCLDLLLHPEPRPIYQMSGFWYIQGMISLDQELYLPSP